MANTKAEKTALTEHGVQLWTWRDGGKGRRYGGIGKNKAGMEKIWREWKKYGGNGKNMAGMEGK